MRQVTNDVRSVIQDQLPKFQASYTKGSIVYKTKLNSASVLDTATIGCNGKL
jgi:hypothetical protein